MPRVFVTRRIPAAGLSLLEEAGIEVRVGQTDDEKAVAPDVLADGVGWADVLLPLLTETVDRSVLEGAPRLRGVANYAVGYDNVDMVAATELGIPVSNTPGVLTESTADLTWALLLAVARRVVEADAYTRAGRYRIWGPNLLLGADVSPGGSGRRKVLGIVGFGRIGQAVARRARGFDMDVLVHDPSHRDRVEAFGAPVRWGELDEVVETSDFLTLHPPLTPETRHLVDEEVLRRMKRDAYLVNVARGPIVDEAALVRALRKGWIAGAALDVYEDEPALAPGLDELDNVVLAPHIGSASRDTRDRMAEIAARNALAHLRGERAPDVVNPEVYGTAAWRMRKEGGAGDALREDARALLDAALAAADPTRLVREALADAPIHRPDSGRIILLSIGKAAGTMARGAVEELGPLPGEDAIVVAPEPVEGLPEDFRVFQGGHPLPGGESLNGARAIRELLRRSGPDDRVLLLLSGGASALVAAPAGELTLDHLRSVTLRLQNAGAEVDELNVVRKHLEELKGGNLARLAEPSPVRVLVLSDVVGDRLDVVGSGPVSPDPSTFGDAIDVLERHGLWDEVDEAVRTHLIYGREGEVTETPKEGDPCFSGVVTRVIGNARMAAEAAVEEASRRGYRVELGRSDVRGEARQVGRELGRRAAVLSPGAGFVQMGETTVKVTGGGRGGRNQEAALAAALEIQGRPDVLVLVAGTDGVDGPTDAAGALATGDTVSRAAVRELEAVSYLEDNDSHTFFRTLDDLVVTGPTGTNVMDFMLALRAREARE